MTAATTPAHDEAAAGRPARGSARLPASLSRLVALAALAAAAVMSPQVANAQFVSTPVTTAEVGRPYLYNVVATGQGFVEITAPNGLPPWLSLVPTGNGTATLAGTPRPGDTGLGITLRSEDTTCRVFLIFCYQYQVFDITIIENRPPAVVPPGIPDQSGLESEAFRLDVAAAFSDPDGDALTFTATGLPQSFSLAGGIVSGTPTNADASGSPFEVTITADDGKGGRVADTFSLTIRALDRADISVESLSAAPAPAMRGEPAGFTVTVANAGPSASGVFDLTLEFRGNPVALTNDACTLSVVDDGQRVECPVGPIAQGETASLTVSGTAAQAGDVYVTAAVSAPGVPLDPSTANNGGAASLSVAEAVSTAPAQTLAGAAATSAAAGDLNADGFMDLAVAAAGASTAIHLNLENPAALHPDLSAAGDSRRGLSTVPLSLEDGGVGTGIALADFDNDADLDVVVAQGAGAASAVFLNNGDGSMGAPASLGAPDEDTRAVAAADLDGDGYADVAFANAGRRNTLFMSAGGTGFEEVALPAGEPRTSVDVAAVDVVGDALPDLIFANEDAPALLYRNLGGRRFAAAVTVDPGPTSSVASGDFNGDAYADLVFGRASAGPSGLPSNPVYLNNGSGGFVAVAALGASPTRDVVTGDVDGDAIIDIVAVNATGAHQVFIGDGNGAFDLHPTLFVSADAAAAALGSISLSQPADIAIAGKNGVEVFFNDSRGNLGLGDTSRPIIALIGEQEMALEVEGSYADPGATATDDVDGTLTPSVDNPVDTKVIGTYTVTYTAVDSAGNAAAPVTRTVRVDAREASGGGGGGAAGLAFLAVLAAGLAAARVARRGKAVASPPRRVLRREAGGRSKPIL